MSKESTASSKALPSKPIPDVFTYTQQFWEGTAKNELLIQVCGSCQYKQWYPRTLCENCGERNLSWTKSSGRGTIFTFTIIQEVVMNSPAFEKEIPYALSIVELEEGVRMVAQVVGCPPEHIKTSMPVEAFFEKINGFSVVKFRPRH